MDAASVTSVTDEQLRFAIPSGTKMWGAEKWERGLWVRQQWQPPSTTNTKPTMHFSLENLSVADIHGRWGEGLYRIVWSLGPGKRRKGQSEPFAVREPAPELDDDDDGEEGMDLDAPPPAAVTATVPKRTPAAAHANGNGHATHAAVRGLPTAQGRPPIAATDYPGFIRTRDGSAMEIFYAQFMLVERLFQRQSENEERRSREHLAWLTLQQRSAELDSQARIAEANARSTADREHAAAMRQEADKMRDIATKAQLAQAEGRAGDVQALIATLQEQIEGLQDEGGDEDEIDGEDGQVAQVAKFLIAKMGPPLAQALAKRIGGEAAESFVSGAINASVEAAQQGDMDEGDDD